MLLIGFGLGFNELLIGFRLVGRRAGDSDCFLITLHDAHLEPLGKHGGLEKP